MGRPCFSPCVHDLKVKSFCWQELNSGKAVGEDKIRSEMLKALNGERVRWLTRVCKMVWKLGKTPKLADRCDHYHVQERRS